MDDQSQSLDTFLRLNQDFYVPDQLFDDSDIGVEDIYNTVEIETSETDGYKTENMVKDGGDVMMTSTAPQISVYNPLQQVLPVTTSNTLNNPTNSSSQGESLLSTVTSGQASIPMVSLPVVTQSRPIPSVTPPATNHAPLKMVSVPVNSDLITQGNSQVVLIPMGGMDSSKLESALKVPFGQKLVIIKPQEILKTIEQKKSQKVQQTPGVVGITAEQARNLAITQQGIVLQSTNQGGFQQIPVSQVGKLAMVGAGLAPAQKGLVKVAPKGVPKGVPILPRPQTSAVSKTSIARPVDQNPSNSNIQPQVMANQIAKPPGQAVGVKTTQQFVTIKQALKTTVQKTTEQSVVTGDLTTVQTTKLPTSVANTTAIAQPIGPTHGSNSSQPTQLIPTQIFNSSNQLGSTTLASQTSLTVQQQPTRVGLQQASRSISPNLYQTLKQKFNKSGSTPSQTNTANIKQTVSQGVKPPVNTQSNTQAQNVQSVSSTTKTPNQKIIVTYVSPEKAAQKFDNGKTSVTTSDQSRAVIQIPAKLEINKQKCNTPGRSGSVVNVSNGSIPDAVLSQPIIEQQPKMIPSNAPQISHIKMEESNVPSTSANSATKSPSTVNQRDWPSIADHETTLNNVVKKRGRPRKVSQSGANTQDNKKTLSGPTLKHELERKGPVSSGRLKTVKPNEHQMKTVKHKRVSSTNPWTCTLCGKVAFADSLGCLYGPYDGESDMVNERDDIGEGGEPQHKRRRGSSEDGSPRKSGTGQELWFHGDCIVWSPGVYALGESLVGYNQVVSDAQPRKCNYCGNNGATLVCLQRVCKKQYHFFCAKKTGCVFQESNYTIQCGKHTK